MTVFGMTDHNHDRQAEIRYDFEVQGGDFTSAGSISTRIKRILQQIGAKPEVVRRASVATYEAEINIVIHAENGRVTLTATPTEITIRSADKGPGIPNIELAMTPGYSTADEAAREMGFGAGMGLPNIARCADFLNIETEVGEGTTLSMVFRNA